MLADVTVAPGAASTARKPVERPGDEARRVTRPSVAACPFLVSADGAWRSATPARDHLCQVVSPAAAVAAQKQVRLCLTAAHDTCPTYLAATAANTGSASRGRAPARAAPVVTRWALVRTAPLVIDAGRRRRLGPMARRGSGPQLALGGLVALALVAVVVARFPAAPAPVTPAPPATTPAATSQAVAFVTSTPTARPTATAMPRRVVAMPVATRRPASPRPATSPATYVVRRGDTLYGIAIEYRTTVEILQRLNGLDDDVLQTGQALRLP